MGVHTISVLVENNSGALSRISGLFSSRGYNISSLTVAETDDPSVSRMTIVVGGEESILEQIVKQLNRLIDVIKVIDFQGEPVVEREMVLVRIDTHPATRHEIIDVASIFGAKIAAVSPASITFEMMGTKNVVNDFITMIKSYGIKELVRSGSIAIANNRK